MRLLAEMGKMEKAEVCGRVIHTYCDILEFQRSAMRHSEEEFRCTPHYRSGHHSCVLDQRYKFEDHQHADDNESQDYNEDIQRMKRTGIEHAI